MTEITNTTHKPDNKIARGVKIIIPDVALTKNAHANLVPNKDLLFKGKKWSGRYQVTVQENTPIEPPEECLCDGDRLLIEDADSNRVAVGGNALGSFVFAIIALFSAEGSYSRDLPGDLLDAQIALGIAIVLILLGLYLIRVLKRMNQEDYYIFDRTTGNVLLPKRFASPAYSMPFSELSLHTVHLATQHGMSFRVFFYPNVKPKGKRSIRHYSVILGFHVDSHIDVAPYWHLICRFMDSSQELPHVDFISDQIKFFKKYNKKLSDIPFELDEEDTAKAAAV